MVNVGRGNVELSPGRKLSITNGVFEVPDTFPKAPPAKARFRLDGSVPAAAELLALERLRDYSGTPLEPATSRGTLTAQVTLGLPLKADLAPGSSAYTIAMDVTNFAAERVVMGQKVEAVDAQGHRQQSGLLDQGRRQDQRRCGSARLPQAARHRRCRGPPPGHARRKRPQQVRLRSGRLPQRAGADQAQRPRAGQRRRQPALDRRRSDPGQGRQSAARLDQAGGQAGARQLHAGQQAPSTRFEDLVIEAPGVSVKGALELDGSSDVQSASFPVFNLSDGRQGQRVEGRSRTATAPCG